MDELRKWLPLKQNDAAAFKKFYRFLLKCLTLQQNGDLDVLNSPMSIRQIQVKLPSSQQDKWSKVVESTRRKFRREANFKDFVEFIDFESSVINDPVYSRVMAQEKKPLIVNTSSIKPDKKEVHFELDKCIVCQSDHKLEECDEFWKKDIDDRKQILYEEDLCYSCLNKGHISVGCTKRMTCSICNKSHPTAMHIKVGSTAVGRDDIVAMCIIPVMVWHSDSPEKKRKVYAVIDNCSQGTFGCEDLLLDDMELPARKTSLTIETAIGTETVETYTIENLHVCCTEEHKKMYPNSPNIKLPQTFT